MKTLIFVLYPLKSTGWVAVTPPPPIHPNPVEVGASDFFRQNDRKMNLQLLNQ